MSTPRAGDELPKREGILPIPRSTFIFGSYFGNYSAPRKKERQKRKPPTCSGCRGVGHRISKCPNAAPIAAPQEPPP